MVYRLNSKYAIEVLIDKIEEKIAMSKRSVEEGFGLRYQDQAKTLEIQVFPKKSGEKFEVIINSASFENEQILKEILGEPYKEVIKDASFFDIVEFIADLPDNISEKKIRKLLKKKYQLSDRRYKYYKQLIKEKSPTNISREYLIAAAKKLQ